MTQEKTYSFRKGAHVPTALALADQLSQRILDRVKMGGVSHETLMASLAMLVANHIIYAPKGLSPSREAAEYHFDKELAVALTVSQSLKDTKKLPANFQAEPV